MITTNTTGQFRLTKTLEIDGKSTKEVLFTTSLRKAVRWRYSDVGYCGVEEVLRQVCEAAGRNVLPIASAGEKARKWVDSALQGITLKNFQKLLNEVTPGKKSVYNFPIWTSTEAEKLFSKPSRNSRRCT
jgi:hypothetical protein